MTVYLDNSATTRVRQEAAEKALQMMTEAYGNPSSTHALGRGAKTALDEARKNVAGALGAEPGCIFFTSGGTEADNWAVSIGSKDLRHRKIHVIVGLAEHEAVLSPAAALEARGAEVTYLKPDETGAVRPEDVEAALREDTAFISLMLVNNETGAVTPIGEIARMLKKKNSRAILHTDAVQAFCKIPFTAATLGADLISVSSHKIHGPKGAGALYVRKGLNVQPLILGGGQENAKRSGTEALPAICAFGEAARLGKLELGKTEEQMKELFSHTVSALRENVPEAMIISSVPGHILSLSLPGYRSENLLNLLDADGIMVSRSSACKRGKRSHVLEAMGLAPKVIDGAIRVSFSKYNTTEEADYFVSRLAAAAKRLSHR